MRYADKVDPVKVVDVYTFDEISDAWKASGAEWAFEFIGFPARRELEDGQDRFVLRTASGSMKMENGKVMAIPVGGGKPRLLEENVLSALYEVIP